MVEHNEGEHNEGEHNKGEHNEGEHKVRPYGRRNIGCGIVGREPCVRPS